MFRRPHHLRPTHAGQRLTKTRIGMESLESRQLLACDAFEAFPSDELFGEGGALDQLQSMIDNATYIGRQVPLIGEQLAGALPFGSDIRAALGDVFESASGDVHERLETALSSVLGPENFALLDEAVDVQFNSPSCTITATIDLSRELLAWESDGFNFDVGLKSLPFYVTSDVGGLAVDMGFDMSPFSLSIDGNSGAITLDTDGTTLNVEARAKLVEGATVAAQIGFLHMQMTDGIGEDPAEGPRSGLEVGFGLMFGPNATIADVDVTGVADIRLHLQSEINDYLPSISTDFLLHYDLTSDDAPDVGFENVSIELGDMVSKLLGPIVEVVEPVVKPLESVMNLLSEPIPVISDLGLGEYSILDIANSLANHGALPPDVTAYVKMVSLMDRIVSFVGLLEQPDCVAAACGDTRLNFGSLHLSDLNNDLRTIDPKTFEPTLVDVSLSKLSVGNLADLSGLASRIEDLNLPPALKTSLLEGVVGVQDQLNTGITLELPIVDNPASVLFQWLVGQNADLFRVDAGVSLPTSSIDLSGPIPIGIDGGLRGGLSADVHLGLGYDTFGLRRFLDNLRNDTGPTGADFLDGFYITGDSELGISGSLAAYLALNALVFSVDAEGGIYAGLKAEVIDSSEDPTLPNVDGDDHKVRFRSEMDRCSFHLSGDIHAGIALTAKLGVQLGPIFAGVQHRWDLAELEIASFDTSCIGNPLKPPVEHVLGEVSKDGVLTLYVGGLANQRSIEPLAVDESVHVVPVTDGELGNGQTVRIQAFGASQVIAGVKQIEADFGNGGDSLTLAEGISVPATVSGGSGSDTLRSFGTGSVFFSGNDGEDFLQGGLGNNTLDGGDHEDTINGGGQATSPIVIFGGAGDDVLIGGEGLNEIHGGPGDDRMTAGPLTNELFGDHGDDEFYVSVGQANVQGGAGNDQVTWTTGDGGVTFDGGLDSDTMSLLGSASVDRFTASALASSVQITARAPDKTVVTQSTLVEHFNVDGQAGADQILVQSLKGTSAKRFSINLTDNLNQDGDVDVITVNGSNDRDDLKVEKMTGTLTDSPTHQESISGGVMRISGFVSSLVNVNDTYEVLAMNFDDQLTLNSRAGDDRISVHGVTGPTFIETAHGDDEVTVHAVLQDESNNGAGDYLDELSIDVGKGTNRLVVSEALTAIDDEIVVTDSLISSRLLPAVHYGASRGGTLGGGIFVQAGNQSDTINVRSTRQDGVTEIHSGGAVDKIYVASKDGDGHLNWIRNKLILHGGADGAQATLVDTSDITPSPFVTVDETTVGPEHAIALSGLAGPTDNQLIVVVDTNALDLTVDLSNVVLNKEVVVNSSNIGSLTFNDRGSDGQYLLNDIRGDVRILGGDGNEHVRVAPQSRSWGDLQGTIHFEAGRGNDQLEVFDQSTLEVMAYELAGQFLRRGFGTNDIFFDATLESLTLNSAQVSDTVHVSQLPPVTNVFLDQNLGDDVLVGPAGGAEWIVEQANQGRLGDRVRFQSTENLSSGGGANQFLLSPDGIVSGTVFGSVAGHDQLDYSRVNVPVQVNLETETASQIGAFRFLDSFVGGPRIDTLVGPSQATSWIITGRGEGTLQPSGGPVYGFDSFENLTGGNSADRFLLGLSSQLNSIVGGPGIDELDYSAVGTTVEVDLEASRASGLTRVEQLENVRGGSGDDYLRGDSATNQLLGQAGNDLILGADDSDTLRGGAGRDVLIGGLGSDGLFGDGQSDLLLAGYTTYDTDLSSLSAIRNEWTRVDQSYRSRVRHLRNGDGLNAPRVLTGQTVVREIDVDQLFGSTDLDWFVVDPSDLVLGSEPGEMTN